MHPLPAGDCTLLGRECLSACECESRASAKRLRVYRFGARLDLDMRLRCALVTRRSFSSSLPRGVLAEDARSIRHRVEPTEVRAIERPEKPVTIFPPTASLI